MKITYTFLKPPRGPWALCPAQRKLEESVPKMCHRTLRLWFDIPRHIKEIQMVVSNRKIKGALHMKVSRACYSSMYISTYLYDEHADSYEYTATYIALDRRLIKDFKLENKDEAQFWVYCNTVETV